MESSLARGGPNSRCSVSTPRSICATTAHLTCRYALRVMVNISRRSGWRRSAPLTAGPCASLRGNSQVTTTRLVGLGRSPVRRTARIRGSQLQDQRHPAEAAPWPGMKDAGCCTQHAVGSGGPTSKSMGDPGRCGGATTGVWTESPLRGGRPRPSTHHAHQGMGLVKNRFVES